MKFLLVAVLLVPNAAFAAACKPDKAAIVAGEQAWTDAFIRADAAAVKAIIADDFVGVGTKGEIYGRTKAIADAAAGGSVSGGLDYIHIRFYGDVAVAQGGSWSKGKNGGGARLVWLDTWACRGGRWQVVGAMDANVK